MRTLALLGLLLPVPALAGPVLEARAAASAAPAPRLGAGLGARAGWSLDLGPLAVVPEGGVTLWVGDQLLAPDVGLRASFGAGIRPGAYAHLIFPLPTPDGPTTGFDAGARLDLTFLPAFDLGVHAGVISLRGPGLEPRTPFVAGVHLTLPL